MCNSRWAIGNRFRRTGSQGITRSLVAESITKQSEAIGKQSGTRMDAPGQALGSSVARDRYSDKYSASCWRTGRRRAWMRSGPGGPNAQSGTRMDAPGQSLGSSVARDRYSDTYSASCWRSGRRRAWMRSGPGGPNRHSRSWRLSRSGLLPRSHE